MRYDFGSAAVLLFATGLAATVGLRSPLARAQDANAETGATRPVASSVTTARSKKTTSAAKTGAAGDYTSAKRYFVEFRARNAANYGHMYVMYGEVNDRQEIIRSEIAGFYPAGDKRDCVNCSVFNWTVGHVVPVPSEIGASDGDLEEQYVLARFRVWIDAAQYQRLVAYIRQRKANKTPWHAFFNNCVTFGRDIAVFMNLKVPLVIAASPSVAMYPQTLVNMLREANGVEKEQAPLKDASGSLPAELAPKARGAVSPQPTTAKSSHATSTLEKPAADEGKVASSTIH
jgi:hypothetical protein